MTRFRQTLTGAAVATALLASLSLPSFAQTSAPAEQPAAAQKAPEPHQHQRGDKRGDRMEHMKQRMEKLKAELKLTPAQQAAWATYTQAMKPGERPAPGDREAFAKLTTPERIDHMRELRTERNAQAERRAEATKAFYATLTLAQQKTFDAQTLQYGARHHGKQHAVDAALAAAN